MKLGSVTGRFGVLRPSGDGRSGHSYNGAAARSFCCFFWRIMTLLLLLTIIWTCCCFCSRIIWSSCCFFWRIMTLLLTIIWTCLDLLLLLLIICSFRWLQLFRVSDTNKDCDYRYSGSLSTLIYIAASAQNIPEKNIKYRFLIWAQWLSRILGLHIFFI